MDSEVYKIHFLNFRDNVQLICGKRIIMCVNDNKKKYQNKQWSF
jgi:hypothetical protein